MRGKIKILLLILLVLVGLFFLVENPFSRRFGPRETPLFPGLKKEAVSAIEIENLTVGIRLAKNEKGDWEVMEKKTELARKIEEQEEKGPKDLGGKGKKDKGKGTEEVPVMPSAADPQKAEEVVDLLVDLKKGTPVSSNPEKHGLFQVSEVGLNVTLFDKSEARLAKLFVGKLGPNFFSTFIRSDGSPEVYLSDENFQVILSKPLEEWVKKEESPQTPLK